MPRAIWSGSISFGLVNVPVKLYSAVSQKEVAFHMLTPDGASRVKRKLVRPDTGDEVEWNQTKRGYEIAPDEFVIVSDEELKSLRPEATRTIDISDFVDAAQIDPVYFDRPYYLMPDDRSAKPYTLLHQAMSRSSRVALATFVMRQRQYLCAIRPLEKVLALETMNYADEIVNPEELPGVDRVRAKVDEREVKMATQLIDALTAESFDPEKYHDQYREDLLKLIDRKAEGEPIQLAAPREEPARVINLVKALEASLAEAKKNKSKQGASSHGRRKKTA